MIPQVPNTARRPITWRYEDAPLGSTIKIVPDCLDGLYDELQFNVVVRDVHPRGWKDILCLHQPMTCIASLPLKSGERVARICARCRAILHEHEYDPSLSESYQVERSRHQSIIYEIETCTCCHHRVLADGHLRIMNVAHSPEIMARTLALFLEQFPHYNDPPSTRKPFGSGYQIELPAWVADRLAQDKENEARIMLAYIGETGRIPDEIFNEIEGASSYES